MDTKKQMKAVYTVVERGPGKSFWTRIGLGFVNRDGSLGLRLDAIPVNGVVQVRDWMPRDAEPRPDETEALNHRGPPRHDLDAPSSMPRRPHDAQGGLA
jgi:hypothetical protein